MAGKTGWVDDVVKMAGKVIEGEGDNVTRLSDVKSARARDALIKQLKSSINQVKSGYFQAGRQALINQKSLDLHKSGMLPLQQGTIVTPPSTWDMPGDWRVSGYWYDEKDPRRFGYRLQNESGQTYDAAASDPRAGLKRDNPYSFGAGFKAYAGPNAAPPKPVASPVEKPAAAPKPPEVLDAINKEYEGLFGSEDPFKPRAHGGRIAKGPGGWLDDVVKMAGKVISGQGDDAAKAGIRAYHGSPHDFDRFDMSKIGTGEGAQAYGHGLYFAEHEPVARGYRDALTYKHQPKEVSAWINAVGGDKEAAVKKYMDDMGLNNPSVIEWEQKNRPDLWAEKMRTVDAIRNYTPGSMYEVRINADPDAFLDWDKPFANADELERFAARFDAVDPTIRKRIEDWGYERQQAGQPMPDGSDLVREVFGGIGSKEAQRGQQMMREAGIPGIKYLDAGSRYTPSNLPNNPIANEARQFLDAAQGDGEKALQLFRDSNPVERWAGSERDEITKVIKAAAKPVTRNYVVFDDKLISIIRKYGIAGASAMLGYNLMEQLDPKQALAASMADQDYQASRPQRSMGGNNSISGALNVARGLNGVE